MRARTKAILNFLDRPFMTKVIGGAVDKAVGSLMLLVAGVIGFRLATDVPAEGDPIVPILVFILLLVVVGLAVWLVMRKPGVYVMLNQFLVVRGPDGDWQKAWGGQLWPHKMPAVPQVGVGAPPIGQSSHRPRIEDVQIVAGRYQVLLTAIKVYDPARLGAEIEERERLGFKRTEPIHD